MQRATASPAELLGRGQERTDRRSRAVSSELQALVPRALVSSVPASPARRDRHLQEALALGPVSLGPVSLGPVSLGPVSLGPVSLVPVSQALWLAEQQTDPRKQEPGARALLVLALWEREWRVPASLAPQTDRQAPASQERALQESPER